MTNQILYLPAICLLVAVIAPCSAAEMLIEDHFPGHAQNPDWLYDWIVGVGGVTFNGMLPGYARLMLDGPGTDNFYHNAEFYQDIETTPSYCGFEVRLRNSNNCGHDAPGWPPNPDPLYGMGSRGWGLWNRTLDPQDPRNMIWFQCLSPESDEAFRSRGVSIVRDNIIIARQELDLDLTQWHIYRVEWRQDYIGVFVDDMETPILEVTDPALIPSVPMTFTTWIDNYVASGTGPDDMVLGWLPVPDFQQYIDVDYIKVYTVAGDGDFDRDGDVDLHDFIRFTECFSGPGGDPPAPECRAGDFDCDSDIDCDDWEQFIQAWTAPGSPPDFPPCLAQTIDVDLSCRPLSGALPAPVRFSLTFDNLYAGEPRTFACRINILTAGGMEIEDWLTGDTVVGAGDSFSTSWIRRLPASGTLIGTNVFTLHGQDVTPAPYNQPPYPPAGDTDTSAAEFTGIYHP